MLPLTSLLNPDPPRAPLPTSRPTPESPSTHAAFLAVEPVPSANFFERKAMTTESRGLGKPRAKGAVNFYPFEDNLDEASLREIRRFRVSPFGQIKENRRRIPYNSGKKDFYQRTGREIFEGKEHGGGLPTSTLVQHGADSRLAVFQYEFVVVEEGKPLSYTVMWDYTVGLVRMTPFFKCCKYSKVRSILLAVQEPSDCLTGV